MRLLRWKQRSLGHDMRHGCTTLVGYSVCGVIDCAIEPGAHLPAGRTETHRGSGQVI